MMSTVVPAGFGGLVDGARVRHGVHVEDAARRLDRCQRRPTGRGSDPLGQPPRRYERGVVDRDTPPSGAQPRRVVGAAADVAASPGAHALP